MKSLGIVRSCSRFLLQCKLRVVHIQEGKEKDS